MSIQHRQEVQISQSPGFSAEQEEQLRQPLDINLIKHRPGGNGKMLKYISGHDAIQAANRIFGYGQWGYRVVGRSHETIQDEKKGTIAFYTADIELYVSGSAYPFPGDGVGIVTAPYTVEMHEKARKEATTDALKRALRRFLRPGSLFRGRLRRCWRWDAGAGQRRDTGQADTAAQAHRGSRQALATSASATTDQQGWLG